MAKACGTSGHRRMARPPNADASFTSLMSSDAFSTGRVMERGNCLVFDLRASLCLADGGILEFPVKGSPRATFQVKQIFRHRNPSVTSVPFFEPEALSLTGLLYKGKAARDGKTKKAFHSKTVESAVTTMPKQKQDTRSHLEGRGIPYFMDIPLNVVGKICITLC